MRPNHGIGRAISRAAIVRYLGKAGWEILRSADTTSREAGKDIEAKRGSRELWVTVKGWPERSVNTQRGTGLQRHCSISFCTEQTILRLISLSEFQTDSAHTRNLLPRIQWMRENIPFDVFKVSESGDVSVLHPES